MHPVTGLIFWRIQRGKEAWVQPEKYDAYLRSNVVNAARCRDKNKDRYNATRRADPSAKKRNSEYKKKLRILYPDKVKQQAKARYARDPDRYKRYPNFREWQQRRNLKMRMARLHNPIPLRLKARENYQKNKANGNLWYKKHHDKYQKSYKAYRKRRRATDPLFRFSCDLRSAIHKAIKIGGGRKHGTTAGILGCSPAELRIKITTMLKPGMTWDNRGPIWQIDHRIPLASATTTAEIEGLWHYTNLRPMWTPDNNRKSDMMPDEYEALYGIQ